jgi:ankyrin repeat protein
MINAFLKAAWVGDLPSIKQMLAENTARITEVDVQGKPALLHAAKNGQLETVMWSLREGGADIGVRDNYAGNSTLLLAAGNGKLETVMWLLREGGAKNGEVNNDGSTALICAASYVNTGVTALVLAQFWQLESVKWLLEEGEARIGEADTYGRTALLAAASCGKLATVQYLLEHGAANIGDTDKNGRTIWDMLANYLNESKWEDDENDDTPYVYDTTAVTSLLRVMMLRGAPPAELIDRLSPEHAQVVEDGARLRAGPSAYLAQRRVLLGTHCPLIPPLRALVHGYEEPTTTDELWATGLGAAS